MQEKLSISYKYLIVVLLISQLQIIFLKRIFFSKIEVVNESFLTLSFQPMNKKNVDENVLEKMVEYFKKNLAIWISEVITAKINPVFPSASLNFSKFISCLFNASKIFICPFLLDLFLFRLSLYLFYLPCVFFLTFPQKRYNLCFSRPLSLHTVYFHFLSVSRSIVFSVYGGDAIFLIFFESEAIFCKESISGNLLVLKNEIG